MAVRTLLDDWFNAPLTKPIWRKEFEMKIGDLELQTGLKRDDLFKVADAMEKLKIIRI